MLITNISGENCEICGHRIRNRREGMLETLVNQAGEILEAHLVHHRHYSPRRTGCDWPGHHGSAHLFDEKDLDDFIDIAAALYQPQVEKIVKRVRRMPA